MKASERRGRMYLGESRLALWDSLVQGAADLASRSDSNDPRVPQGKEFAHESRTMRSEAGLFGRLRDRRSAQARQQRVQRRGNASVFRRPDTANHVSLASAGSLPELVARPETEMKIPELVSRVSALADQQIFDHEIVEFRADE